MDYCGNTNFHYWFFFPIGWIIFILLIFLLWGRLSGRRSWRRQYWSGPNTQSDLISIVKERYAKGEITKEQFEDIKKDLAK